MGAGMTLLGALLGWAFFLQGGSSGGATETWRGHGFLIDARNVRVGPVTVRTEGPGVLALGLEREELELARGADERLLVGLSQHSLDRGGHVYGVSSFGWRSGDATSAMIEADSLEAGSVFTSRALVGGLRAGRRSAPGGLFRSLDAIREALDALPNPPPVTVVLLGRKPMEALDVAGPALLSRPCETALPGTLDAFAGEKARRDLARMRDPASGDSIAERAEKLGWSLSLVH